MKVEPHQKKAWKAYKKRLTHLGHGYATPEGFREVFEGEWDTEECYARHIFNENYTHSIPDSLKQYIDYEAYARDLFTDEVSSIERKNGGVYVFRN